ncbi:MAG: YbhB/YbcL family Raf kinase inhibitor-like protein [Candidatus Nanopelagicales bacterium]|nr:YbhB/YbcL family Raf kinase inhibitor-like protein [Candidatus Nanopelagicales bacterium]MDZ4250040.1 YbhB/YbcL family Raf kinase inhibitor-like protein [Candidatus Nanopelagicales bacterium]MDZ7576584.1 YbhB/YbcL family Raf kinase inhibitor-like protein [Candidatus Nanopelagicales bacterium]
MRLDRPEAPHPHDALPVVPSFSVESDSLEHGEPQGLAHAHEGAGGQNVSPHLRWWGFPAETRSFAVTCFDPDAPTGSGWWHWLVIDIPATVTELEPGAGDPDKDALPPGAVQIRNDYGEPSYGGSSPPPGDRPHRYVYTVHALDVPKLGIGPDVTAAICGFNLTAHTLARASVTTTFQVKSI